MVHFQIKGREWMSIPCLIDSRRDIGLAGGRQRVRLREV
jgi:hypothetical protein